ncbi:UNVERIFIED_ORG: hypothetical protein ABIB13_000487 [Arthrobacter sp. UYEF2]
MSDIILGWDPAGRNRWNYAAVIDQAAATGLHLEPWSVGRSAAAGGQVQMRGVTRLPRDPWFV